MDLSSYLFQPTINDATLHRTVALALLPIQSADAHSAVISGAGPAAVSVNASGKRRATSSLSSTAVVGVDTIDGRDYMAAPSTLLVSSSWHGSRAASGDGGSLLGLLTTPVSVLLRAVPNVAAAIQTRAVQTIPMLWKLTPPVLISNNNSSSSAPVATSPTAQQAQQRAAARFTARFVAIHPHRRVIAVATPQEGSSKHGAVCIYDLSSSSSSEPTQVLRNVLLRDMCGVEWKPGSRNVLCVYGHLGAALFHLSIDPVTGLDAENAARNNNNSNNDLHGDPFRPMLPQQRPIINNNCAALFVQPGTGGGGGGVGGGAASLGVGCLYPASEQLARFGLAPAIDRVAFFAGGGGRLLACASTSSSGIRVVDLAFSPMEQLHAAWDAQGAASSHKHGQPIAGTFCGSPAGGTHDMVWLPSGGGGNAAVLLLRAVAGANAIELFAAGCAQPITSLATELPVAQMVVSSWPVLEDAPPAPGGGGGPRPAAPAAAAAAGAAARPAAPVSDAILRNIARNGHHGIVGQMAHTLLEADCRPDRHVPLWLVYDRVEGAVLTCLSFHSSKVHRPSDAPVFVSNLMRICTTAPGRAPASHPGGRVTRIALAKETATGSKDSGTVLLSVESGHVIAVKISRNSSPAMGGGAGVFAAQTTLIMPLQADDDDEHGVASSSPLSTELAGAFFASGNSSAAAGGAAASDVVSFVTWSPLERIARVVTTVNGKTERAQP